MPAPAPTKILIVDDREENLLALEAILGGLGHDLLRATSGPQALKHLLVEDVSLILLDVQMPEMDGYETAAHIKSRPRTQEIPIILPGQRIGVGPRGPWPRRTPRRRPNCTSATPPG